MLATNLPLMKQKFSLMLQEMTGVMYKAAYDAYYESVKPEMPTPGDDNPEVVQSSYNSANKAAKDCAEKFAKTFVKSLKDGGFMDSIADEIDGHVKSMMLTISIPTLLPTIISPMGPCTGALTISQATGAQITIS